MRRSPSATPRTNRHSQYLLAGLLAAAFPLTSLANINWTNTAGGLYFTATNWSSNPVIPGNADTVVFNLGNSYTVQFDSGPTNTNFLFQQGTVTWVAANAPQTYTLTSASGPVISGGKLTLGNASAPALTVAITGGLAVQGTSAAILVVNNNSILNAGNIDLGDNGLTSNSGTIDVGATVTQSGNSTLTIGAATKSTGTLDIAAGTYTSGAGLTTINAKGKISLAGGSFNLNGNLTVTGGSFTQTGGTFTWAGSQTMTIQSGGNVSLAGSFGTLPNETINVTGNGTQLNDDTGSTTADLAINNGSTLSVTAGGSVHSDRYIDIGATGNGTVTVDGIGSSFSTAATNNENFLGTAGTGSLTFSTSATGSAPGGFAIGDNAASSGTLNVQSGAVLTTGGLDVADLSAAATGIINVTGGTLTQTGSSYLTVGQDLAFGGTATVIIGTGGTFTTGTGDTTIGATGTINLAAGTFNVNGNITVTGGAFTQTGGTLNWAASQTMTIQSGGNVTLTGAFLPPANANITVTGNGSQFNNTDTTTARLAIDNGATLAVSGGGSVHSDRFIYIADGGNGTVTVDGPGSSFSASGAASDGINGIGTENVGSLTFSTSATGSAPGGFIIGFVPGSSGTLNVQSSATLTTGPLNISDLSYPATGVINVTGGTLTQSGNAGLTVGQDLASGGTATVNIGTGGTGGTFTTGTAPTSIGATGNINLITGTFNVNGALSVIGGAFTQTGGTFNWAASQTMTIQSGGVVTLAGQYLTPANAVINISGNGSRLEDTGTNALRILNGATVSVTSGGTLMGDSFINIGFGTVTIDGSNSSFSTGTSPTSFENVIGNSGNAGTLTFSNLATGSTPNGIDLGLSAGSSGTLNVQLNATLTSGPLDVADQGAPATGVINVVGGTLIQSGGAILRVGQNVTAGGTGTVNIGNATTSGTFSTGTGATSIGGTGTINLVAGAFNANGNITVTGGSFTQTGGTFAWADSQTMTIQSGGVVTLAGLYLTPANAVINISGNGSKLEDTGSKSIRVVNGATVSVTTGGTFMGDTFLNIGFGTVTIDGSGSSFSTGAPAFSEQNAIGNSGNAGTLTFSSLATGSVPNGFELGLTAGSSGTLNVQSNATLTCGPLDVADAGVPVTGVINVVGGTLIQSDVAPLTVGQDVASGGTATVNIGNATTSGNFTTGTGDISIGATGTINLIAGTFNLNGNVTNAGNLTLAGAQTWAATTSLTNTAGKTTFASNAKLYGLSITGGTVDITSAKIIVEAASNKSATLATLRADVSNSTLISTGLPANESIVVVDNAIRMVIFPTSSSTFGGNPIDANSILITAAIKGDANLDGIVDLKDLQVLATRWQQPATDWSEADFDGNGIVALPDLQALALHWQAGVGSGGGAGQSFADALALIPTFSDSSVPEPASLATLAISAPLLLAKRRRKQ